MTRLGRDFVQVVLAALVAFAITAVGQGLWGVLVAANVRLSPAFPWAAILMPLVLAALVAVASGRGWPRAGAAQRRALVPFGKVPGPQWRVALAGGACGVVALAGLWIVLTSLVPTPPNRLASLAGVPAWSQGAFLLVAIIAAPATEEIAFRGYAMGLLSRRLRPWTALLVTSALFAAAHLTQGFFAPKLTVYFLVGLGLGWIALKTGSLLPAMAVHSFGDLVFFVTVWRGDATRIMVGQPGWSAPFLLALALVLVLGPASIFILRRLGRPAVGALAVA